MKIIYILVFSLLISLLFLKCSSENKVKTGNSSEIDLSESEVENLKVEEIDSLTFEIDSLITKNFYAISEFNSICSSDELELYLTKYKNTDSSLIKIEITLSNDEIFQIIDYYFFNSYLIQKYDYYENFGKEESLCSEIYYYCQENKILMKTQQNGSGFDLENAYENFDKNEIEVIEISEKEFDILKSEIDYYKTVKSSSELPKLFCK